MRSSIVSKKVDGTEEKKMGPNLLKKSFTEV
jgi:hypothetical protein